MKYKKVSGSKKNKKIYNLYDHFTPRQKKVKRIENEIKKGLYRADYEKTAEKMVIDSLVTELIIFNRPLFCKLWGKREIYPKS